MFCLFPCNILHIFLTNVSLFHILMLLQIVFSTSKFSFLLNKNTINFGLLTVSCKLNKHISYNKSSFECLGFTMHIEESVPPVNKHSFSSFWPVCFLGSFHPLSYRMGPAGKRWTVVKRGDPLTVSDLRKCLILHGPVWCWL